MHMRMNKDTIWVQGLGKVLSGKQHPNLQDLGKLLLLGEGCLDTGSRPSVVMG